MQENCIETVQKEEHCSRPDSTSCQRTQVQFLLNAWWLAAIHPELLRPLVAYGKKKENCTDTTWHNTAVGFPQCNLDMLTGAGQYVGLAAQITYDPTVYAQIAVAAIKVWKALPNKGAGEQLSKVLQGPLKPYPEFFLTPVTAGGVLFWGL